MTKVTKSFESKEEFRRAHQSLTDYQIRHNIIRNDYALLLDITESFQDHPDNFNSLFRASIKGFFSLIESDIYGLNQVNAYDGYSDKHSFEDKFKKTFKHISLSIGKLDEVSEFMDSKYRTLKNIRFKRDKLVHPQNKIDIITANTSELDTLKNMFQDYTSMLHSLMNGFFINISVNQK